MITAGKLKSKFSIGDNLVIYSSQYADRVYPIKEIRIFEKSGNILLFYETSPGHKWCVYEKHVDENNRVNRVFSSS